MWLSVKDSGVPPLDRDTGYGPIESEVVLVVTKSGGVFTARLRGWADDRNFPSQNLHPIWVLCGQAGYLAGSDVTHWQWLPALPDEN